MYRVDRKVRVVALAEVPLPSPDFPSPLILCGDRGLILAYRSVGRAFTARPDALNDDGSPEPYTALIRFLHHQALLFGPPGEESLEGHPLASRGLEPNAAFVVEDSPWIRALADMDSADPCHDPLRFEELTHYIFVFRDSTFECAAEDLESIERRGAPGELLQEMQRLLFRKGQ